MNRALILICMVACLMTLAVSSFAYDKHTDQALLGNIENPSVPMPRHFPGATDNVTWTMVTPCPQNFQRSAIARLGNYVYLMGNYLYDNWAEAFNVTTENWEASTPPTFTGENWVGVAANGSIYVFPTPFYSTHVQKFTPIGGGPTGTWMDVAPYPQEIGAQAAAWDGGNFIYCAGGYGPMVEAYKYDLTNNTFTPIAPLPQPRSFPGGAFLNGKFYVVGGLNDASQYTNNLYEYNPTNNTWTEKAPASVSTGFTLWATTYNSSYLFVVGGGGGYLSWPAVDACQVYNPATDTWFLETPRPLNTGTNEATYVTGLNYLTDGGGYDGSQSYNVWWKGLNPPGGGDPNAPAAPTNFIVNHNNAQLMATLHWTNPSTTVNGQPLSNLSGIIIYRNTVLIDTVTDVQIGQPYTYNDNVPSANLYQYRITPYNSYGAGLDALASAWIGLDTPGASSNVVATPDSNQLLHCTLTWTAPTAGAHQGYWPPGSWTGQRIYRDTLMIADLPGTHTSYLDSTVPHSGFYTYGVSYYNASGEGPRVNAPPVLVGTPLFQQIPYDWVEINTVGTNTGLIGDDQTLGPFSIGFSFPFYNSTHFDSVRVCSNGFASFTSTSAAYENAPIPTVAVPNNLLAIFWDDLQCNVTDAHVWYYRDAANNRFIIEWEHVKKYGVTGSSLTFEIILYPNGNLDYMYNAMTSTILNSATVGIEDECGTVGIQCTYNGSGPLNPASNMGLRIFSVGSPIPAVEITLTPVNPHIHIPAIGGSFLFNAELDNHASTPQTIDAWIMVQLPNMTWYGPVLGPINLTLPPLASVTRARNQNVPASAPAGNYNYEGRIGTYPNPVLDNSSFPFTKLASGEGSIVNGWDNTGESFCQEVIVSSPAAYRLDGAYPNPFNPMTTIRFTLSQASMVNLWVYNLQGRLVSELVNGMQPAGTHQVTFDGSKLSSGLYFCQMQVGDFNEFRKMVLMK